MKVIILRSESSGLQRKSKMVFERTNVNRKHKQNGFTEMK